MGSSTKLTTIPKMTFLLTFSVLLHLFLIQANPWSNSLWRNSPKPQASSGFEEWLSEQQRRKARIERICWNKTKQTNNLKLSLHYNKEHNLLFCRQPKVGLTPQTWTRVSNLEKSREILTSLAPSRSKKLNFHSLSLLHFQDFEEKILFLFSIYENLKHKSRSLLDLDLEFSSGSVCVWN